MARIATTGRFITPTETQYSLNFTSTSDFVAVTDNPNLNFTSQLSFVLWVKPRSFGTLNLGNLIVHGGGFADGYGLTWRNNTGQKTIRFCAFNTTYEATSNRITLDKWNHIVVTLDESLGSGQLKFFINGSSAGTGNIADPIVSFSADLNIGGQTGGGRTSDSFISSIKLYNRALTSTEALDEYYGRPVSTTGLVLFHKYNEGSGTAVTDSSSGGNSGTITGATYSSDVPFQKRTTSNKTLRIKEYGTSLYFSGSTSTDRVSYDDSDSLDLLGTLTLSAWIKPRGFGTNGVARIIDKTPSNNSGYSFLMNGGTNTIRCFLGTTDVTATANSIPVLDRWYHVALTYNKDLGSDQIKFFVNGVAQGVGTKTANITINTNTLLIGNINNGTNRAFHGNIDDVRVYNRDLSATEIETLYYGGDVSNTGLVLHSKLDEGSGSETVDTTGIQSVGTITGATFSTDVFTKGRTLLVFIYFMLMQSGFYLLTQSGSRIIL